MGYHLEPSLTVANVGPHTLGTFERHPHLGGQSFPSVLFLRLIDLVIGTFQASAQMPPRGIYSDVTLAKRREGCKEFCISHQGTDVIDCTVYIYIFVYIILYI
jgi:hypothetical protein